MNTSKKLLARVAAGVTTLGLAVAGSTLVGAAPATAALTETDYGFQATAYGTKVVSNLVGLASDRTAFSYLSCTRIAGKEHSNKVAGVALPTDSPMIQIGAVTSKTRSWKNPKDGIAGAVSGTNSIASVALGAQDGSTPLLSIEGLKTTSTAWADKDGKLHAENTVKALDLNLINLPEEIPAELRGPLDDLLAALEDGIGQVIAAIQDNAGTIVIPGLGEVSVGYERVNEKENSAAAEAAVLDVLLYGADTAKGGGDDSMITIGHSWARINKDLPAGVMSGKGFGATAEVFDGIVGVGELGLMPMPCRGTEGKVRKQATAGLNLGNVDVLTLGAVDGRVWGKQYDNGRAEAWTEGRIVGLTLGPLEIKGIVGRANVAQGKGGEITRKDIEGSAILEILMDGESQGGLTPAEAKDMPPLEIPGIGKVEFFKTSKNKRGLRTSAVVITLLEETPAGSVIRLGNAQVKIKKY